MIINQLLGKLSKNMKKIKRFNFLFGSHKNITGFPTHPTQIRHILTLFSAHWLLTLADRLSPLSMVANPNPLEKDKKLVGTNSHYLVYSNGFIVQPSA